MWRELIVIVWRMNCCWRGLRARVSIAQWEEYICALVLNSSRLWSVSEATADAPSTRGNRQRDRHKDNFFVNPVNILSAQAIDRLNICFASHAVRGYDRWKRLNGKSNRLKLLATHFHFHSRGGIFQTRNCGEEHAGFLILSRVRCLNHKRHNFSLSPGGVQPCRSFTFWIIHLWQS